MSGADQRYGWRKISKGCYEHSSGTRRIIHTDLGWELMLPDPTCEWIIDCPFTFRRLRDAVKEWAP